MKTKPDDSVLLRRLEKHHPDVLKAEIDFDAESAKIINADPAKVDALVEHIQKQRPARAQQIRRKRESRKTHQRT